MATPAQPVPMYAPDGTLGDVPYENMHDAVKAGGVPAVNILDPTGKPGSVPANRVHEAVAAGAKVVPYHDQEIQHPGAWASIVGDLGQMVKGIPAMLSAAAPVTPVAMGGTSVGVTGSDATENAAAALESDQSRKAAGNSAPYRAAALAAGAAGTNVEGMEQSANEGDTAGVVGHAVAPLLPLVAAEGARQAGRAVAPAAQAMGEKLYQSALKPPPGTYTTPEVERMVSTGLNEHVAVSAGGVEKITGIVNDLNNKVTSMIADGSAEGKTIDPKKVAQRAEDVRPTFNTVNPDTSQSQISGAKAEYLDKHTSEAPYTKIRLSDDGPGFAPDGQGVVKTVEPTPTMDAQLEKQRTYTVIRKSYGELKSAQIEAQKALARGIKEELEVQFPEIKSLNARESNLLALDEGLQRAVRRIGNHQLFGLGTPAVMGAADLVTGSGKAGLAAGIMKATLDQPLIKSKVAIALSRASKGALSLSAAQARLAGYSALLGAAASKQQGDQSK